MGADRWRHGGGARLAELFSDPANPSRAVSDVPSQTPNPPGSSDGLPALRVRPDLGGWHDYIAGRPTICPAALECSDAQMADYMARFAVPGQDPAQPAADGSLNVVRDPWFGIPAGLVWTYISKDGLTTVNQTSFFHVLHDGTIVRTSSRQPDGSWVVSTHGYGNNWWDNMDRENQIQGPGIFQAVDESLRSYILRDHGRSR